MAILQNTTVSGSLVITGDLTARQFILSSSVTFYTESFASGSTRFGDSPDDFMRVTGSLIISSSLGVSLFASGSSGSVGIGTNSPAAKLHVVGLTGGTRGGATSIPALGFTNSSSVALFTNFDTNYGTLFGTLNTGTGWIQQGRTDGTGTAYNLALQPSGGYVGIGTNSPAFPLEVYLNSSTAYTSTSRGNVMRIYNSNLSSNVFAGIELGGAGPSNDGLAGINAVVTAAGSAALTFYTRDSNTFGEKMRIFSDGNITTGGTNTKLIAYSAGNLSVDLIPQTADKSSYLVLGGKSRTSTNDVGVIDFAHSASANTQVARINCSRITDTSVDMVFSTNAGAGLVERMRITSGGFLKASNTGTYLSATGTYYEFNNNSSNNFILYARNTSATPFGINITYTAAAPNDSSYFFLSFDDTSGQKFAVKSNGGISNFSANDTNLSDERTKKEISPLESYWNKFKAIEIVKFKYKDQTHDDFNIGVIAQQVETVAPEFIDVDGWDTKPKLDEDGNEIVSDEEPLKSIYTADLYHATIKVLQEAMAKIETLETENNSLKEILTRNNIS